eukprot:4271824-Pleurochrysis_carterae.AAC.1
MCPSPSSSHSIPFRSLFFLVRFQLCRVSLSSGRALWRSACALGADRPDRPKGARPRQAVRLDAAAPRQSPRRRTGAPLAARARRAGARAHGGTHGRMEPLPTCHRRNHLCSQQLPLPVLSALRACLPPATAVPPTRAHEAEHAQPFPAAERALHTTCRISTSQSSSADARRLTKSIV